MPRGERRLFSERRQARAGTTDSFFQMVRDEITLLPSAAIANSNQNQYRYDPVSTDAWRETEERERSNRKHRGRVENGNESIFEHSTSN
jgi:hypothetical protein|uniref:Uncharacterized protein n=2 Tax=Picea TaxID=3328 RepID=A0A117NG82_PICGL|nr:hypothetical protein ABT39_MTgene1529 [Picea glauca]QHR90245.1 hypothetical protein Q903MT_gene4268 [Picea sitchensis]